MASILISIPDSAVSQFESTADILVSILRSAPNVDKLLLAGDRVTFIFSNVYKSSEDSESELS